MIKDFDTASDVEKSEKIEEASSPLPLGTPSSRNLCDGEERAAERPTKTIRFEDGDPENPNNWPRVSARN